VVQVSVVGRGRARRWQRLPRQRWAWRRSPGWPGWCAGSGDDYAVCQQLADAARMAGIDGLLTPSAGLTGDHTLRSAPSCWAAIIPSNPTAPSPTTATVLPGPASAATAPNQPVPGRWRRPGSPGPRRPRVPRGWRPGCRRPVAPASAPPARVRGTRGECRRSGTWSGPRTPGPSPPPNAAGWADRCPSTPTDWRTPRMNTAQSSGVRRAQPGPRTGDRQPGRRSRPAVDEVMPAVRAGRRSRKR